MKIKIKNSLKTHDSYTANIKKPLYSSTKLSSLTFLHCFFSIHHFMEKVLDSICGRFSTISVGLITSNEKGKNRQYVTASFGTHGLMLFELQKDILK